MNNNYFSVDDILASQTRVPCKFEVAVTNLGYLDPSSGNLHIQPGTELELPFWLIQGLCSRNRHIVSVEMPGIYKLHNREVLIADAMVVDLHKNGPYFYDFGLHLLQLAHSESNSIAHTVIQTFKDRFRIIMDLSQNTINEDVSKILATWDELERSLFHVGQKCLADFHNWQSCESDKIQTSTMVMNHRKRKRSETDT